MVVEYDFGKYKIIDQGNKIVIGDREIRVSKRKKAFPKEKILTIIKYGIEGIPTMEIADLVGTTQSTVSQYLRASGVRYGHKREEDFPRYSGPPVSGIDWERPLPSKMRADRQMQFRLSEAANRAFRTLDEVMENLGITIAEIPSKDYNLGDAVILLALVKEYTGGLIASYNMDKPRLDRLNAFGEKYEITFGIHPDGTKIEIHCGIGRTISVSAKTSDKEIMEVVTASFEDGSKSD